MNLVVEAAASQKGYSETGRNNNKFGKFFKLNGKPWCGLFVLWCYMKAYGVDLRKLGLYLPDCTTAWNQAVKLGWTTRDPKPGCIVIMDFHLGNSDREEHMGVFVAWVDDDEILTWEGNTGANNTNGGQVMLRRRSVHNVRGYINPPVNQQGSVTQPRVSEHQPELNPSSAAQDFLNAVAFALAVCKSELPLKVGDGTPLGRQSQAITSAVKTLQHGLNTAHMPGSSRPGLYNGNQLILLAEDGRFDTRTQLVLQYWQQHVGGLLPDGEFGAASFHRMFEA